MSPKLFAPAALALLAACNQGADTNGPVGEDPAAALDNAANQADPAAAAVMRNQADQIRNGVATGNLADPQGAVQNAMEQAGQAPAATPANPSGAGEGATAPGAVPPSGSVQARPNLPTSRNRKDGTVPPDRIVVQPKQETDAATRPK